MAFILLYNNYEAILHLLKIISKICFFCFVLIEIITRSEVEKLLSTFNELYFSEKDFWRISLQFKMQLFIIIIFFFTFISELLNIRMDTVTLKMGKCI